jgi:hypothetical protein
MPADKKDDPTQQDGQQQPKPPKFWLLMPVEKW